MGKRSLQASKTGQAQARQAFERTRWTQEQLALEVGLNTRQSVWKFLSGRPIERHIFIDLCFQLSLDWEEIADLPAGVPPADAPVVAAVPSPEPTTAGSGQADWVQQLRTYLQPHIAQQCGILQSSLDLGRPLSLEQLYTPIRIVPHLRQQQWLDLADLQSSPEAAGAMRLAQAHPESVDAVTVMGQTPKMLLLGKPGAGKTTFLKHIANQCIAGHYRPDCIPLFMTLRHGLGQRSGSTEGDRPQSYLWSYVSEIGQGAGLAEPQLQALLRQGQFLLLLDGLDEVATDQINGVLTDIQWFTQSYPDNPCLITSRLTSNHPYLPGFFNTEVDDFSADQIQTFVQQWFAANLTDAEAAGRKTHRFLEALDTAENQPLKELVVTPILLSLLCSVFLARSDFPKQRAKLYQAGLDILLQRWDQARGIQRSQTYQSLSVAEKLQLLGAIAATTFEAGRYFFEKPELLDIITRYLQQRSRRSDNPDLETLHLESEAILQDIQLQHGLIVERAKDIYSFSHLTFQEYLTARKILYPSTPEQRTAMIVALASHTLEPSWHEVLRLTANMMTVADPLIQAMYGAIQGLIYPHPACQTYLQCLDQKAATQGGDYRPAAVRAFYFTLLGDRDLTLATALDGAIAQSLTPDLALDLALARAFEIALTLTQAPEVKSMLNLVFALALDQKFTLAPAFQADFQALKQALPDLDDPPDTLDQWWLTQGHNWVDTFQTLLVNHRNLAPARLLTVKQRALLQQYYQLHLLLMDCLQASQVTPDCQNALMAGCLKSTLNQPADSL